MVLNVLYSRKILLLYGFMVTPNDNVLYIQDSSWRGDINIKPSRKTGSGCQCFEEPFRQ